MKIVFYDKTFEKEAEAKLEEAYSTLPPASTYPGNRFPKMKVTLPGNIKGTGIEYDFHLYRAPDRPENNRWNVASATRVDYTPPVKKKPSES
jgi:hypothetical protein